MSTNKCKVVSASLLAAALIAGPAWAGAGDPTPNSTTTIRNVSVLFDGQCFREAFASQYAYAEWYPAYAQSVANTSIWGQMYVSFNGALTFTTTRHGNAGAVYQVDLNSTLGSGRMTYGTSNAGAAAYSYARAGDWWNVAAESSANTYGTGYASGYAAAGSTTAVKVFAKGANITEFTGRIAVNAQDFTDISSSAANQAWAYAFAWTSGGYSGAYAEAYANAWAQLLTESVVYLDVVAHYKKKPGNSDEMSIVIDSFNAYLTCGGSASPYAAAYVYVQ